MSTIFYTISLSLFDSLSTTFQIIVFILLLTTEKPLRNALGYLAGLSGSYFLCGLAGYLALDELRSFLAKYFPDPTNLSNPLYYQSEFFAGVLMVGFGIWYFNRKKKARPGRAENFILLKLRTMNLWFAFCAGIFMSVTSFPVSIPYLLALGSYSALHLELPAVSGFVLLYNIGYASPMILILFLYLVVRRDAFEYNDTLHEKVKMLNIHLTTWSLVGFGFFSMIDAGCYFALGHALLKGRYF